MASRLSLDSNVDPNEEVRPTWASPSIDDNGRSTSRTFSKMRSLECSSVEINIIDTELVEDHTLYILQASSGIKQWEIARRFRDFAYLDKQLRKKFPDLKIPPLPPKRYLFSSTDPALVEERRSQLENYLKTLMYIAPIWSKNDLVLFLNDESNSMMFIWNFERMRKMQDTLTSMSVDKDAEAAMDAAPNNNNGGGGGGNSQQTAKLNSDLVLARTQVTALQERLSRMEMLMLQQATGLASEELSSETIRSLSGVKETTAAEDAAAVAAGGGGSAAVTLTEKLLSELNAENAQLYGKDGLTFAARAAAASASVSAGDVHKAGNAAATNVGAGGRLLSSSEGGGSNYGANPPPVLEEDPLGLNAVDSNLIEEAIQEQITSGVPLPDEDVVKAVALASGSDQNNKTLLKNLKSQTPEQVRTLAVSIQLQEAVRLSNQVLDGEQFTVESPYGAAGAAETSSSGRPSSARPSLTPAERELMKTLKPGLVGTLNFQPAAAESTLYDYSISSSTTTTSNNSNASVGVAWPAVLSQEVDDIIAVMTPSTLSLRRRHRVFRYVRDIVCRTIGVQLFPIGSLVSHTYLPDGHIETSAFVGKNDDDAWFVRVNEALCMSSFNQLGASSRGGGGGGGGGSKHSSFDTNYPEPPYPQLPSDVSPVSATAAASSADSNATTATVEDDADICISNVSFVNAETKKIKILINGLSVDIAMNQARSLYAQYCIEKVDAFVGKQHLFKRAVLLVESWCRFESPRLTQGGGSLFSNTNGASGMGGSSSAGVLAHHHHHGSSSSNYHAAAGGGAGPTRGTSKAKPNNDKDNIGAGATAAGGAISSLPSNISTMSLASETAATVGAGADSSVAGVGLTPWAVTVMLMWVFNKEGHRIHSPIQALGHFLRTYAMFDWSKYALTVKGPVSAQDPASSTTTTASASAAGEGVEDSDGAGSSGMFFPDELLDKFSIPEASQEDPVNASSGGGGADGGGGKNTNSASFMVGEVEVKVDTTAMTTTTTTTNTTTAAPAAEGDKLQIDTTSISNTTATGTSPLPTPGSAKGAGGSNSANTAPFMVPMGEAYQQGLINILDPVVASAVHNNAKSSSNSHLGNSTTTTPSANAAASNNSTSGGGGVGGGDGGEESADLVCLNLGAAVDIEGYQLVTSAFYEGYRQFQRMCESFAKVPSSSSSSSSSSSLPEGEVQKLLRGFFANIQLKVLTWNPTFKRKPGGLSLALSSSGIEADTVMGASTDDTLQAQFKELEFSLRYAEMVLGAKINRALLIETITRILQHKGNMPVGEVGKNLQAMTGSETLSKRLKEQFGGLKRAIEQSNIPRLKMGTEHPFNPTVILSPEEEEKEEEEVEGGVGGIGAESSAVDSGLSAPAGGALGHAPFVIAPLIALAALQQLAKEREREAASLAAVQAAGIAGAAGGGGGGRHGGGGGHNAHNGRTFRRQPPLYVDPHSQQPQHSYSRGSGGNRSRGGSMGSQPQGYLYPGGSGGNSNSRGNKTAARSPMNRGGGSGSYNNSNNHHHLYQQQQQHQQQYIMQQQAAGTLPMPMPMNTGMPMPMSPAGGGGGGGGGAGGMSPHQFQQMQQMQQIQQQQLQLHYMQQQAAYQAAYQQSLSSSLSSSYGAAAAGGTSPNGGVSPMGGMHAYMANHMQQHQQFQQQQQQQQAGVFTFPNVSSSGNNNNNNNNNNSSNSSTNNSRPATTSPQPLSDAGGDATTF